MITKKNILNHELIGLNVQITNSKNKTLMGRSGLVVDETKNSFTFREKKSKKESKVIKKDSTFSFEVDGKKIQTKGENLVGNQWERLKKKIKVKNRWQTLE